MTDQDYIASRPRLRQAFRALREPAFRQWFASQILSASGTMTQSVAQSWLVLRLTGSGLDLGLMGSLTFLPLLIAGPWAGALVDRFDTRRVLLVTQSLFIAVACLLAVLVATGSERLWMLFAIAIVTGMIAAPDSAARQVYVVELVGTSRVASAISLNEVVINSSRVLGPAVGGALLATVGVAACCVFNAASYLLPLAVLIAHRTRAASLGPTADTPARTGQQPPRPGRLAGLGYAWRHPAIRVSVLLAAAAGMLFSLSVPLPLLATRVFHLGGGGYGLMMAVFGLGALPGALLAAAGRSSPSGRSVGVLAVVTALAILATACAPSLALVLTGLAVTGCVSIWFIARANTLVQLAADPDMRGRVMGVWNMALPGCTPITSPLVGLVDGVAGARAGFGLAGVALLLVSITGWHGLTARPPVSKPRPVSKLGPDEVALAETAEHS
jgi:MFS family permease